MHMNFTRQEQVYIYDHFSLTASSNGEFQLVSITDEHLALKIEINAYLRIRKPVKDKGVEGGGDV